MARWICPGVANAVAAGSTATRGSSGTSPKPPAPPITTITSEGRPLTAGTVCPGRISTGASRKLPGTPVLTPANGAGSGSAPRGRTAVPREASTRQPKAIVVLTMPLAAGAVGTPAWAKPEPALRTQRSMACIAKLPDWLTSLTEVVVRLRPS